MSGIHQGGSCSRRHHQIGTSSSHPYGRHNAYQSKTLQSILMTKGEDVLAQAARFEGQCLYCYLSHILTHQQVYLHQRGLFIDEGEGGREEMDWEDVQEPQNDWIAEVLEGSMPLGISHQGGELDDLAKEYQE